MKREGRQHGMVRTSMIFNSRPNGKVINGCDSPSTAGLFTKVSSKPTNHSKFTSKCEKPRCNGCHLHPSCKSRCKSKGTHKLKSCDVAINQRLMTWRVVDRGFGLNCIGFSASDLLSHLSGKYWDEFDDEEDPSAFEDGPPTENTATEEIEPSIVENKQEEDMDYYFVEFVWDCVDMNHEDEDWCLIGEM